MELPDGSQLMHGDQPYDPAKAHEYYLRYRKLHPRTAGAAQPSGSFTVAVGSGKTVRLSAQQLAEQKAYAAERTAQIKKKLDDLNVLLRDKLEKAKASAAKAAKPPTLAEKAQAARDAKKYRDSHKQVLANKAKTAASKAPPATKAPAAKVDTVDSLKKEIVTTKNDLKAAVAKQRELATAKKNG